MIANSRKPEAQNAATAQILPKATPATSVAPIPRLAVRMPELCASIDVGKSTVKSWLELPDPIPHVRIGGVLLFPLAQVAEWLAAKTREGTTADDGIDSGDND